MMSSTANASDGDRRSATKQLRKQIKNNLPEIKSSAGDDNKLSRIFDKIDPNAECGIDFFNRHLRSLCGVKLKSYIPS